MSLKSFFAKIILGKIVKNIGLEEGKMDSKYWYKSKTIWAAIVTAIIGAIQPISAAFGHPIVIPSWVLEVLVGLGLYGLRTASKDIV